ncbi:hypothetical protein EV207_12233 [Scopulibacillus darangshiensis]|uniref:Uncharacterized protein n=1 Tax=Scopulibacillus darangshiensis TaxID=442528 RepID=A0A4R2NSQ5_9BACL|nr:hypothetical protein EV207_12233 [Scopulibacillus darangshiensis]
MSKYQFLLESADSESDYKGPVFMDNKGGIGLYRQHDRW